MKIKQYTPYILTIAFALGVYTQMKSISYSPTSTVFIYESTEKCEEPFTMTFTLPNIRIENINRASHFQIEDSKDFGKILIEKVGKHKYKKTDIASIDKTECTANGDCWITFSFTDNDITTKNNLVIDPVTIQKGGNINRSNGFVIDRKNMCS